MNSYLKKKKKKNRAIPPPPKSTLGILDHKFNEPYQLLKMLARVHINVSSETLTVGHLIFHGLDNRHEFAMKTKQSNEHGRIGPESTRCYPRWVDFRPFLVH